MQLYKIATQLTGSHPLCLCIENEFVNKKNPPLSVIGGIANNLKLTTKSLPGYLINVTVPL
jgi:hypothetical protein